MPDESGFGIWSIIPPLATICLAIATRRVLLSLLAGIAFGVALLQPTYSQWMENGGEGNFLQQSLLTWMQDFFGTFLFQQLIDSDHMSVIIFTTMLSIQVALIHRSGGMQGVVKLLAPFAKTRRGGQVVTWFLGLLIFIDDYANTLLLGATMRPVTDRLRISREKLAYLVDSTAAPVAGMALISTWVSTEISFIAAGYEAGGVELGSQTFSVFLATIPVRFYIIFALLMVLIVGLLQRDFGPMLAAERRAFYADSTPSSSIDSESGKARWWFAVFPIFLTVAIALYVLYTSGLQGVQSEGNPLPDALLHRWAIIIGNGNSYLALLWGSGCGLLLILAMVLWTEEYSENEVVLTIYGGIKHVSPALLILWFAWTLSALTSEENLGSGQYLATVLEGRIQPWLFPTLTFLLAGAVAFSTGTSWGTMATLFPLVIPLVIKIVPPGQNGGLDIYDPILIGSIGSVLAGAIWGDHCSPISDTTVLSSRASDCDHIAHVRTQLPYAALGGVAAILFGTLPLGFGVSTWILLPAGIFVIAVFFRLFGKTIEHP